MTEYVNVRASETLEQEALVAFIKTKYPKSTIPVGRKIIEGTECVEIRVRPNSPEFEEIRQFINAKRKQGLHGFIDCEIGWYLRKYTKAELKNSEILKLMITSHFEPSGEECGTIYKTICHHCNLGRQVSDLILDLRNVPQHKDISETIAWIEWIVSSKFVQVFKEHKLTGAKFLPIINFKNPLTQSAEWYQLRVIGKAGELDRATKLGRDPFTPGQISWRCPLGHSMVTAFLSEIHLKRRTWEGSDIAITDALFGQGRNLLRPTPFIFISQRMYRALREADIKGLSYEMAHLV